MGLRMPWEITEGSVFSFLSVRGIVSPGTRFLPISGKRLRQVIMTDAGPSLNAVEQGDAAQPEPFQPPARLVMDKAKKDFLEALKLLTSQEFAGAAERLRKAVAKDDSLADAYFALSLCTENGQEQLQAVDRAQLQRGNFTRHFREFGISLSALFKACDAKQVRIMSDLPGLELLTAEVFQNHGKWEDAQRILENSEHADIDLFCFSRGELLLRLQRYDEAIDILKKLNRNRLLAGPSYYMLGLSLEKLGYASTAVQVYRNCLEGEVMSRQLEVAVRRQLYFLLVAEGREYRAQRELERLAALAPEYRNLMTEKK